jgi:hypothetical protein
MNNHPSAKPGSVIGGRGGEDAAFARRLLCSINAKGRPPYEVAKLALASVPVPVEVLAAKHYAEIIEPGEVKALANLVAAVKVETDIIEEHNVVLLDDRIRKAVSIYANAPTAENKATINELRSLQPADHYEIQQRATERMHKLFDDACPLFAAVTTRARDLVQASADQLAADDAERYGAFGLEPIPTPLEMGLRDLVKLWEGNLAAYSNGRSGHTFPSLIDALVKTPALIEATKAELKDNPPPKKGKPAKGGNALGAV